MKKTFKLATIALSLIAGVAAVSIPFVHADQQIEDRVVYICNEDGTLTPAPHVEGNYEVNENGQTYGVRVNSPYFEDFPDLQPVLGDHGIEGYAYTEDLLHKGAAKNPEEALAQMEAKANGTYEPVVINVYESDGVTVIDTFTETVLE
ncbi:MAG: hypothetical protein K2K89_02855 [Ruminococcus sp.]|nr:hypothetical protein [Ruminococcus sp.]